MATNSALCDSACRRELSFRAPIRLQVCLRALPENNQASNRMRELMEEKNKETINNSENAETDTSAKPARTSLAEGAGEQAENWGDRPRLRRTWLASPGGAFECHASSARDAVCRHETGDASFRDF